MKRILAVSLASVLGAVMFAAAPAPVAAQGFSVDLGGGSLDFGDDDDDDVGISIDLAPPDVDDDDDDDDDDYAGGDDDRHVAWCSSNYRTYDEDTNLYFYAAGKQRECNSPFD